MWNLSIKTYQSSKLGKWACNMVTSIVNQPAVDGLYHPFMVNWGMVYNRFNPITRKWEKTTWDMTGKAEDNLGIFWKTSQLGIYWKISGRKRRIYRMIWFTGGKGMMKDDWLVFWNMNFMFPCIWNNHPSWRTPSFFRGVGIPPTSIVFWIAPNISHILHMVYKTGWFFLRANEHMGIRCLFPDEHMGIRCRTEEYRKDQAGMLRGVGTCTDLDVAIRNWNFNMPC